MKKTIFQDSFMVSGIMCHHDCGRTIQRALNDLSELKRKGFLPADAQVVIDAEPQVFGVHRLMVMVEVNDRSIDLEERAKTQLSKQFKANIEAVGFEVIDEDDEQDAVNTSNWVNIIINLLAIATIIVLSIVCPPSLPLIIGLTALSFLTTAYTARSYFRHFFRNLRHRDLLNMPTSITLAWVLSLAHALYHSVMMPLMFSFAMTFMNFIMPVMLVAIVNIMDEMKRLVLHKSKKMHLNGMKALFPGMADEYFCYQLSKAEENRFKPVCETAEPQFDAQSSDSDDELPSDGDNGITDAELSLLIQDILQDDKLVACHKNVLQKGMIIQVKRGNCFPVDGTIIQGRTRIDASILNGEPQQSKQVRDSVPAGAINLGDDVIIRVTKTCYNSRVNKLLFHVNRAQEYGLVKWSDAPEKMTIDELKKRLKNKPSYVLCNSQIYYIDRNLKITELQTRDFKQLESIFPRQLNKLNNASKDTLNKIKSLTNHTPDTLVQEKMDQRFTYLYMAFIMAGVAVALLVPYALGVFTIPLMLQTITGILFAVCPCTIAIAHQLPSLFHMSQCNDKGIIMRNGDLTERFDDIHTVVFDKTGTLTTGDSAVHEGGIEGISPALWQRIYLLEDRYGLEHPLAKAICGYCKKKNYDQTRFTEVTDVEADDKNRGLSAHVQGKRLYIGNAQYLKDAAGVTVPEVSAFIQSKLALGYTPVYVAEYDATPNANVYHGVIFIEHTIKPDVITALLRLKTEGKKLIMLTGDHRDAALGFNRQNGAVFDDINIHAEQTPKNKEQFLDILMSNTQLDSKGVWFVGDGLNDAPCARMVTDQGGVSCAMTSHDKAAFFTDISLNDSLDYLFEYKSLNRTLKKTIMQNQWLLVYGAVAFLAFIITLPIMGVAMSPLIPVIVMVSTTFFTVFNSYRLKLVVDNALDKKPSWLKQCLASDRSLGLLVVGSALLIVSVLIATVASGNIAVPALVFTAGAVTALSSTCLLAAMTMLSGLVLLGVTYFMINKDRNKNEKRTDVSDYKLPQHTTVKLQCDDHEYHYPSLEFSLLKRPKKQSEGGEGEALGNVPNVFLKSSPTII
ncbi:MAG: HAD-IC family P-type ATPase [Legionellaceae bacterium]|nr:HAD-IC family P-type ATPase [Legionellaceae bacterium]